MEVPILYPVQVSYSASVPDQIESPGQNVGEPSKRTQHCTLCKNHGTTEPKKGHTCPFLECPCRLCILTRKSQMAMRHQQRVWRHQKQKLKSQNFENDEALNSSQSRSNKSQACDKCRNHNELNLKRNHKCPFQNCFCPFCSLTFKRRELMKYQQRVRRSRIVSDVELDSATTSSIEENAAEGACNQYRRSEPSNPNCSEDELTDAMKEFEVVNSNKSKDHMPNTAMQMLSMNPSSPSGKRSPPRSLASPDIYPELISLFCSDQGPKRDIPPPLMQYKQYHDNCKPVCPELYSDSPSLQPDTSSIPHNYEHLTNVSNEEMHSALNPLGDDSNSSSLASHHFPKLSQLLQRIPPLCTSIGRSMVFETLLPDCHLQKCNWLTASLKGSASENTSASLSPQAEQSSIEGFPPRSEFQRSIRSLPLNLATQHQENPTSPFSQQMWNQMVLSFNLGFHQHSTAVQSSRGGINDVLQTPGINSRNVYHTA